MSEENELCLPEKKYLFGGRTFILRPMTIDKLIDYLVIVDEGRKRMAALGESGEFQHLRAMAERIPEVLGIALVSDGLSREEVTECVKQFPCQLLERIADDFFLLNPSWGIREGTDLAMKILGLVAGRAQPKETGEPGSSD